MTAATFWCPQCYATFEQPRWGLRTRCPGCKTVAHEVAKPMVA